MIDFLKKFGFRNENHAIWFAWSMICGTLVVLVRWQRLGRWVYLLPLAAYIYAILASIYVTIVQKKESTLYSKDCIWFNTIMVVFYAILMYKTQ